MAQCCLLRGSSLVEDSNWRRPHSLVAFTYTCDLHGRYGSSLANCPPIGGARRHVGRCDSSIRLTYST